MAFFKFVGFVGEVPMFAINLDFQCTNAVIKIHAMFFLHLYFILRDAV